MPVSETANKVLMLSVCVFSWMHGASVGVALGKEHLLSRLMAFTLVVVLPYGVMWRRPMWRRLGTAFYYFLFCSFLMTTVKSISLMRNPVGQPLPDLGHDILPEIAHVDVPGLGRLPGHRVPDVIVLGMVAATAVMVLVHEWRWVIARRFLVVYGTLMLMRAVIAVMTYLPSSSPACDSASDPAAVDTRGVIQRTITLLLPPLLSNSPCRDTVFSGHAIMLVLLAMTWHSYFRYTPAPINPVKVGVWVVVLAGLFSLVAVRVQYTIDVLLAIYFAVTVWASYHRLCDDIATGMRFTSVWVVDKLLIYPAVEWLEDPRHMAGLTYTHSHNPVSRVVRMAGGPPPSPGPGPAASDSDSLDEEEVEVEVQEKPKRRRAAPAKAAAARRRSGRRA